MKLNEDMLRKFELGIRMIETAYSNNLKLGRREGRLHITAGNKDIDREQAGLVAKILQRNSDAVQSIACDQDQIRVVLAETQAAMAVTYEWLMENLDLWDRLQKVYRKIYTEDTACIRGDKGCLSDAIAVCAACSGGSNAS